MTIPSSGSQYKASAENCHMCFKKTDAPIISIWNAEINEKIKLCSDVCLGKYNSTEQMYKDKAQLLKQKRLLKLDLSNVKEPKEVEKKKEVDEGDIVLEDV